MSALDFMLRNWREILALTGEHLWLVAVSTAIAVGIGIPTGLLLTRRAKLKRPVLAVANILQTVPSLALFGFLIPLPLVGGIGARSAIVALVVYALLPVIRNTVTGVEGVDRSVREAAAAMGMTDAQILRQVELPLAAPVILAGVRVATVISVGVATIAAAIGAGGLGTFIFRGLRQYDNNLILAGAIPAALLALAADAGIGLIESSFDVRRRVARGARTRSTFRRVAVAALALVVIGLCLARAAAPKRAALEPVQYPP
jgi:osmoprotectant transport system permease protein